VWQLKVGDNEARDVWWLHVERAFKLKHQADQAGQADKFEDAYRSASTCKQRATVLAKQAEFHFDRKEYRAAARLFARVSGELQTATLEQGEGNEGEASTGKDSGGLSSYSGGGGGQGEAVLGRMAVAVSNLGSLTFEKVCLKFLECGDNEEALEVFLEEKLRLVDPAEDKMQVTMLCTWLLELYLKRFIYLPGLTTEAANLGLKGGGGDPKQASAAAAAAAAAVEQERVDLEGKVNDFLDEYRGSLDAETTFQLLTSHGCASAILKFAQVSEDSVLKFERIAHAHYERAQHATATATATGAGGGQRERALMDLLQVLDTAPFEKVEALFYKYAAPLLLGVPGPCVVVWKRKTTATGQTGNAGSVEKVQLQPDKLVPALVQYSRRREEELLLKLNNANNASNKTGPLKGGGKGQDQAGFSSSLLLIRHHAVEYLEHCVDCLGPQASTLDKHGSSGSGQAATGNTGRAHTNAKATIFHYLLLLYAKEPDGGASLVKFLDRHLQTEVGHGVDPSSAPRPLPPFDLTYALRLCAANNQDAARVRLYAAMGLFEEAVALALQVGNVEFAKQLANSATASSPFYSPTNSLTAMKRGPPIASSSSSSSSASSSADYQLKRRLWLLVAKHVVQTLGLQDPKRALNSVLEECPKVPGGGVQYFSSSSSSSSSSTAAKAAALAPVLRIEDLLPFFPDFVTIDDFKAKIVESLEAYDVTIDDLKTQMDEFTENAKDVHRDIEALERRPLNVDASSKCALTGWSILTGPFYVFPSGYAFGSDALVNHVTPHLPLWKQRRVRELCSLLNQAAPLPTRELVDSVLAEKSLLLPPSSSSSSPPSSAPSSHQKKKGGGSSGDSSRMPWAERLALFQSVEKLPFACSPHAPEFDAYQNALDNLVAGECPLTGTVMIESVDLPLLSVEDLDAERAAWEI